MLQVGVFVLGLCIAFLALVHTAIGLVKRDKPNAIMFTALVVWAFIIFITTAYALGFFVCWAFPGTLWGACL